MKMTLKGGLFLRGVTKDSRDLGLHNWGGQRKGIQQAMMCKTRKHSKLKMTNFENVQRSSMLMCVLMCVCLHIVQCKLVFILCNVHQCASMCNVHQCAMCINVQCAIAKGTIDPGY